MSRHATSLNRRLRVGLMLAFGVLGIQGCHSSHESGPTEPPATGGLAVTIAVAEGVTPSVAVNGPGGYHQLISATGTLTGLAPGSYTVTAESVTGPGSIVPVVYDATIPGEPVTVSAEATATASVSYAARPGTGMLWVASVNRDDYALLGYTEAQLTATTSVAPAVILTATGGWPLVGGVSGVAIDAHGNLWMAHPDNNTVSELSAAQLATSGTIMPTVLLSAREDYPLPSLSSPSALAFDASGNLWVANSNCCSASIVAFTPDQLVTSGAPTPTVVLHGCGCDTARCYTFCGPSGLAFDPSGNLWMSDIGLLMIPASQLVPGGSGTLGVALNYHQEGGSALAFDPARNLWLGGFGVLVEFTPSQLATTALPGLTVGFPEPTVALSGTETSLWWAQDLAFDASGNLWVANGRDAILRFTGSQLVSSGAPVPHVVSGIPFPAALAFNPHAGNLPLK